MIKILTVLLVSLTFNASALIDKLSFYKAFESSSQKEMETKLDNLSKLKPSTDRDAFIGALTMKASQFSKSPKEKAQVFKEGKELLEKAIAKDPKNPEYRFLRLAIQENTPKILKYNGNIEDDLQFIYSGYSSLGATVKKVVKEYSKQSENLSSSKLK